MDFKTPPPKFSTRAEVKKTLYLLKRRTGHIHLWQAVTARWAFSKSVREKLIGANDGTVIDLVFQICKYQEEAVANDSFAEFKAFNRGRIAHERNGN